MRPTTVFLNILRTGRVLTALIMFLIFLSMTILAMGYTDAAALMPLMIGIPGTILGLVQLVMEYRVAKRELAIEPDDSEIPKLKLERKNEIQMILWMVIFFIGLLSFGFTYASPILVFSFLYIGKKESLTISIISSVCTLLVIYGFFIQTLQIPLFNGLIVEWLFD
ncbi:MAG: tripartite tricarboxylate transporter TctB family protein, partial [Gammaproteobacteria bacterium]|jgi:hypothetical protein